MIKKVIIFLILLSIIFISENLFSKLYPAKPINLKVIQEDYKVRITWEIEKPDETIQYFEVYRGEKWKKFVYLGKTYSKDQMYFLDYSIF